MLSCVGKAGRQRALYLDDGARDVDDIRQRGSCYSKDRVRDIQMMEFVTFK